MFNIPFAFERLERFDISQSITEYAALIINKGKKYIAIRQNKL